MKFFIVVVLIVVIPVKGRIVPNDEYRAEDEPADLQPGQEYSSDDPNATPMDRDGGGGENQDLVRIPRQHPPSYEGMIPLMTNDHPSARTLIPASFNLHGSMGLGPPPSPPIMIPIAVPQTGIPPPPPPIEFETVIVGYSLVPIYSRIPVRHPPIHPPPYPPPHSYPPINHLPMPGLTPPLGFYLSKQVSLGRSAENDDDDHHPYLPYMNDANHIYRSSDQPTLLNPAQQYMMLMDKLYPADQHAARALLSMEPSNVITRSANPPSVPASAPAAESPALL